MFKVNLLNEILHMITQIERNRFQIDSVKLPRTVADRLRKNAKKKSTYASNKIESNPLTETQADVVIDRDERILYYQSTASSAL